MAKSKASLLSRFSIMAAILVAPSPTMAQDGPAVFQQQEAINLEGTVVTSNPNTVVLRLDNGLYQLFALDRDATRPELIPIGSRVRTVSTPGDEPGLRIAHTIAIVEGQPAQQQTETADLPPPIPPFLREIERDIERQARRYGVGVRAGVGVDPELVLVGVHARMGPVFHENVLVRPNVEFGIGEVTALVALNLEAVYRLSGSSTQDRWWAYAGAGPGFNFTHQNFERFTGEGTGDETRIDFGEFEYSTSLNILGGIQYRGGAFIELKSSLYSEQSSGLRLIFGYNF